MSNNVQVSDRLTQEGECNLSEKHDKTKSGSPRTARNDSGSPRLVQNTGKPRVVPTLTPKTPPPPPPTKKD